MLNFSDVSKKVVIRSNEKDDVCVRANKFVTEKNPYEFYNYLDGVTSFTSYLRGKVVNSLAVPFFFKICDNGSIETTFNPTKKFVDSATAVYYASVESSTYIPMCQMVKCETEHPARSFFVEKLFTLDSPETPEFEKEFIIFSENMDVLLKIQVPEIQQAVQKKMIAIQATEDDFLKNKKEIIRLFATINVKLLANKENLTKSENNNYSLHIRCIPEDENIRNMMNIASRRQVYFADPTILCGYQMAPMLKDAKSYKATITSEFTEGMYYEDIHDYISGTKEEIEATVKEYIIPMIEKILGKCQIEYKIFQRNTEYSACEFNAA